MRQSARDAWGGKGERRGQHLLQQPQPNASPERPTGPSHLSRSRRSDSKTRRTGSAVRSFEADRLKLAVAVKHVCVEHTLQVD